MCDRTICSFVVGALALEDITTAKVKQSQMILQTPTSAKHQEPLVTWEKLPDDFILPDDPEPYPMSDIMSGKSPII
ncbi:hypothetical protein [Coleofasciculus sp. E2-BRE-01]|uniref:hypothetical protein n=1 Tax=Coleofasciculus sp. E2-BRE-01 TaxID=3069524 RepID=UPI0033021967